MADVIRVGCPQCKAVIQIRAERAGMSAGCPRCQTQFKVPGASKAPSQPKIIVKPPAEEPASEAPPPPEDAPAKKTPKAGMPFSITAVGMWAGSGILMVVSALMILSSVRTYSFKSNFREALRMHDSRNPGQVGALCEKALGWNGSFHPARELWAKVLVDSDSDDVAEDHYNALIRSGYKKPSVFAGLGVLYLRRADKEKDAAKAVALTSKAQEYFSQARSIPEGEIGTGLCALMLGLRQNNSAKIKEARATLEGVAKNLNDKIGRDGLIDLYFGLGCALLHSGVEPSQAEEYFNRANQFDVAWPQPQAGILLLRARRLVEQPLTSDEYKLRHESIKLFLEENLARATNPDTGHSLLAPTREYVIACLINFIRNADYEPVTNYIPRLRQHAKDQYDTLLSLNEMWRRYFDPTDPRMRDAINNRAMPLAHELAAFPETAKHPATLSVAINNAAVYSEFVTWTLNMEAPIATLVANLKRATDADPKNYAAWRNMALLLKRGANREHLPDKKAALNEQCQAALKKAEEVAAELKDDAALADAAKLKEFCRKP